MVYDAEERLDNIGYRTGNNGYRWGTGQKEHGEKCIENTGHIRYLRNIYFVIFNFIVIFLFYKELAEVARLSFDSELYSHIPLIPLISVAFLFKKRKTIFSEISYSFQAGIPVVITGGLFFLIGKSRAMLLNQNDYLSLMVFSFLLCFIGSFIVFFGTRTFRKAIFPLLFLIFIVPIPTFILEPLIRILLIGSAGAADLIFKLFDVTYYRNGFIFELPGITVEVAKQCSGIRSSLALFITSIIAGHLFLQTNIRRIALFLFIIPLTIFKNSLRIVTLSLLASEIDAAWITNSWLHKSGGQPFFILALLLLTPVLLFLRRSEARRANGAGGTARRA